MLYNGIFTAYEYIFDFTPFCYAYSNIYLSLNDLEILDEFNFNLLQKLQVHKNLFVQKDPDLLDKLVESYLHNCRSEHSLLKT